MALGGAEDQVLMYLPGETHTVFRGLFGELAQIFGVGSINAPAELWESQLAQAETREVVLNLYFVAAQAIDAACLKATDNPEKLTQLVFQEMARLGW
jgi:hypothetical protein